MKHKIVFFDMDGTLYQTENDIVQPSSIEAIDELRKRGYMVCAATGRPLNQMDSILKHIQFDYYILINGSYILDGAFEEVDSRPISKQTVKDIVEFCSQNELGLMFHFGDATYIYNKFYPMYDFCKYCNVLNSLFYDPSQSYHKRHRAYNAVILTKEKKEIDDFMAAHPDLRADLINVKSDGFMFDVFNSGNDKSVGIELMMKHVNFTWKDTIAFGDSTNDIHMLQKADIGVAMGGATDYVKSFANFSTTSVYDNGIYNGIKKILDDHEE